MREVDGLQIAGLNTALEAIPYLLDLRAVNLKRKNNICTRESDLCEMCTLDG